MKALPVRARASVSLLFALMGSTMGSWAARIPTVKAHVGLDDRHWGYASISSTAGSLLALVVVSSVIGRLGPRRLALTGAVVLLVDAPLAALSRGPLPLVAGLLVQGFAANLLSTPMNAQAVEVEKAYGRRIMASFHACFSVGMLAGGLAGAAAARAHVSPSAQLATTGTVLALLLARSAAWLPGDVVREAHERRPLRARLTPQLGLLGAVAFASSLAEGTCVQWSALYSSDALGRGAAAGATTYACFSATMTLTRACGDRVVHRVGRALYVRLSACVALAGILLALGPGTLPTAYAGFALAGVGLACIVPTVYGIAGSQPGMTPGEGISVATLGQWPAFLVGPLVVGGLAGAVGLRPALLLVAVAAVAVAALSLRLREPGTPVAQSRALQRA
ncbi:fucose permease [Motilibacter peucedani]|uniref:Fucose permease n=1 Tax=Motilibacter peucedani TaxID=598650 RepID=A0A420XNL3_9ACTN|nr:MFS transporter [Motilibacter peucedani]RKS73793.1 fucose permease [Motilibacter peucedani]